MTGTNAEKAHYKRIQRARRVAEGMVRCEVWLTAEEAFVVDAVAKHHGDRAAALRAIVRTIGATGLHLELDADA